MKNNNEYTAGVADSWYSGQGRNSKDLWIEWKFIILPRRLDTIIDLVGGTKPAISPLQQHWITQRRAEGRNVWIGVGCKEGGMLFCGKDWPTPFTTQWFKDGILERKRMAERITLFVQGSA